MEPFTGSYGQRRAIDSPRVGAFGFESLRPQVARRVGRVLRLAWAR
jgi:hypothetical protein